MPPGSTVTWVTRPQRVVVLKRGFHSYRIGVGNELTKIGCVRGVDPLLGGRELASIKLVHGTIGPKAPDQMRVGVVGEGACEGVKVGAVCVVFGTGPRVPGTLDVDVFVREFDPMGGAAVMGNESLLNQIAAQARIRVRQVIRRFNFDAVGISRFEWC